MSGRVIIRSFRFVYRRNPSFRRVTAARAVYICLSPGHGTRRFNFRTVLNGYVAAGKGALMKGVEFTSPKRVRGGIIPGTLIYRVPTTPYLVAINRVFHDCHTHTRMTRAISLGLLCPKDVPVDLSGASSPDHGGRVFAPLANAINSQTPSVSQRAFEPEISRRLCHRFRQRAKFSKSVAALVARAFHHPRVSSVKSRCRDEITEILP